MNSPTCEDRHERATQPLCWVVAAAHAQRTGKHLNSLPPTRHGWENYTSNALRQAWDYLAKHHPEHPEFGALADQVEERDLYESQHGRHPLDRLQAERAIANVDPCGYQQPEPIDGLDPRHVSYRDLDARCAPLEAARDMCRLRGVATEWLDRRITEIESQMNHLADALDEEGYSWEAAEQVVSEVAS